MKVGAPVTGLMSYEEVQAIIGDLGEVTGWGSGYADVDPAPEYVEAIEAVEDAEA